MGIATLATFGVCSVLYVIVCITGYVAFGVETKGDVLKAFPDGWDPATVARVAISVNCLSVFPLSFNAVRASFTAVVGRCCGAMQCAKSAQRTLGPTVLHVVGTLFLVTVITVIGVVAKRVEVVLGYKGAVFGSLIVYVYPGIMFASLSARARRSPLPSLSYGADGGDGATGAFVAPLLSPTDADTALEVHADVDVDVDVDGVAKKPLPPPPTCCPPVQLCSRAGAIMVLFLVWGIGAGCVRRAPVDASTAALTLLLSLFVAQAARHVAHCGSQIVNAPPPTTTPSKNTTPHPFTPSPPQSAAT